MKTDFLQEIFKPRDINANKGTFGHVTIIGGCQNYIGAPKFTLKSYLKLLTCLGKSAMLSGCGTTTIALPSFLCDSIYPIVDYSAIFKLSFDEEGIVFSKNEIDQLMDKTRVFAIGMGAGTGDIVDIVKYILDKGNQYIILDADGLNQCKNLDFKNRAILTPHPGEMLKMYNEDNLVRILENSDFYAKDYAQKHNCIVLLKGHITTISDGLNVFKNTTGNEKLSKGGSGDCLAGIIAGILAFGTEQLLAARAGAYILGKCAELSNVNSYSHLPVDIINQIPNVIDEIILGETK